MHIIVYNGCVDADVSDFLIKSGVKEFNVEVHEKDEDIIGKNRHITYSDYQKYLEECFSKLNTAREVYDNLSYFNELKSLYYFLKSISYNSLIRALEELNYCNKCRSDNTIVTVKIKLIDESVHNQPSDCKLSKFEKHIRPYILLENITLEDSTVFRLGGRLFNKSFDDISSFFKHFFEKYYVEFKQNLFGKKIPEKCYANSVGIYLCNKLDLMCKKYGPEITAGVYDIKKYSLRSNEYDFLKSFQDIHIFNNLFELIDSILDYHSEKNKSKNKFSIFEAITFSPLNGEVLLSCSLVDYDKEVVLFKLIGLIFDTYKKLKERPKNIFVDIRNNSAPFSISVSAI